MMSLSGFVCQEVIHDKDLGFSDFFQALIIGYERLGPLVNAGGKLEGIGEPHSVSGFQVGGLLRNLHTDVIEGKVREVDQRVLVIVSGN